MMVPSDQEQKPSFTNTWTSQSVHYYYTRSNDLIQVKFPLIDKLYNWIKGCNTRNEQRKL